MSLKKDFQNPMGSQDDIPVHRKNGLPEEFSVSVFDLIILYTNVLRAKDMPDIGYENLDESFSSFIKRLKSERLNIKRSDLEAALWAAGSLDDSKTFWHPLRVPFKKFLGAIMRHKQLQFYFDRIYYRFVKTKPRALSEDRAIYSSETGEQI